MRGGEGARFGSAKVRYCRLAILKGQEIVGIMPVTKVPRMPEFVPGDNWAVPAAGKRGTLARWLARPKDIGNICVRVLASRRGSAIDCWSDDPAHGSAPRQLQTNRSKQQHRE